VKIVLKPGEQAFLTRVQAYCQDGLTQPEMAKAEGLTLSGFQSRLKRLGFDLETTTNRELVRVRSGESFASLLTAGAITTQDEPEPALA
jgi:hypothetical protein